MFTADQLVAHAVGDYILQTSWMANTKTRSHVAAGLHAFTYALPFLLLRPSPAALAVIIVTHFLIDRYRLARYVCWAMNQIGPLDDRSLTATGFPAATPPWLAALLLTIDDNILHVLINGLALGVL